MKGFKFVLQSSLLGAHEVGHDPIGWDSFRLILDRSQKYHGIQHAGSLELEFVKDGREYIRTVYETEGVEAEIHLTVFEYDPNVYQYFELYTGRLQLDEYAYKDEDGKLTIETRLEQTGFTQKFLNRDEILLNLNDRRSVEGLLTPPMTDMVEAQFHSKIIPKQYKASPLEFELAASTDITEISGNILAEGTEDKTLIKYCQFGLDRVVFDEIAGIIQLPTGIGGGHIDEDPPPEFEPSFFYEVQESGEHSISINLSFRPVIFTFNEHNTLIKPTGCGAGGGTWKDWSIELIFKINEDETIIWDSSRSGCNLFHWQFPIPIAVNWATTVVLSPGDEVRLFLRLTLSGTFHHRFLQTAIKTNYSVELYPESVVHISQLSATEESPVNVMLPWEAFARLVNKMTDATLTDGHRFYSSLFGRTDSPVQHGEDGEASKTSLTNGALIRGFPLIERPLYAKFSDLYQSMDAVYNIGAGVEKMDGKEVVRIEKKEYFYRSEISLELGEVVNLKKSVAREYYYNFVTIGFQKWANELVNNLDEYNTKHQYSLPISQIKNELMLLSKYIASGYSIEDARRLDYENNPTTDHDLDNENFLVCLVRDNGGWQSERNDGIDAGNIIDPASSYNLRITPKRNLMRWGNVLHAALIKYPTQAIRFTYGEGNYQALTKLLGELEFILENANIPVSSLPDPLWIPEYYEFEHPVRREDARRLIAKPHGRVRFRYRNLSRAGFVQHVEIDVEEKLGLFKLLRAYDNS